MEQRKEYYKDPLTNEKIIKKFESQFDLVNYAIRLAENMITPVTTKVKKVSRIFQTNW